MGVTLHGIKNCDTVKKARKWLETQGIDYNFRDFREDTPTPEEILAWMSDCDWQAVINKRSTTWKQLASDEREQVTDADSAARLAAGHPTLVKRPVLTGVGATTVGFDAARYQTLFDQSSA